MNAEDHEMKLAEWLGDVEEAPPGLSEALYAFAERGCIDVGEEEAMAVYCLVKKFKESGFPDELEM